MVPPTTPGATPNGKLAIYMAKAPRVAGPSKWRLSVTRFRFRRLRAIALALSAGVLAVTAPTALAGASEDIRSPDARDAAAASQQEAQSSGDLRSPDARDAALGSQQAQSEVAHRDLRSPDARDAALGTTTGPQPAPEAAPVETRTVIAVEERGSQTLAIVFSVSALILALLALGFTALARRTRPRWTAP